MDLKQFSIVATQIGMIKARKNTMGWQHTLKIEEAANYHLEQSKNKILGEYIFMRFLLLLGLMVGYAQTANSAVRTLPFTTPMNAHDATLWVKSDGWSNKSFFQVGWRADHLAFTNSLLNLTLDNTPACSLTSTTCSNEKYASGEYRTIPLVSYGRVTFRAKAVAANGVVTGLFLYTGAMDNQQHDEIDIEFLGKDTTQVQFNYYLKGVGGHESVLPLGFDAALGFHNYMIEWLPSSINWYVDGVLKHSVTGTSGVVIPSFAQHIFLNLWAAKGVVTWTGPFVYASRLIAQVDQVSYTPAVGSNAATSTAGSSGCSITTDAKFDPIMLLMILCSMIYLLKRKISVG